MMRVSVELLRQLADPTNLPAGAAPTISRRFSETTVVASNVGTRGRKPAKTHLPGCVNFNQWAAAPVPLAETLDIGKCCPARVEHELAPLAQFLASAIKATDLLSGRPVGEWRAAPFAVEIAAAQSRQIAIELAASDIPTRYRGLTRVGPIVAAKADRAEKTINQSASAAAAALAMIARIAIGNGRQRGFSSHTYRYRRGNRDLLNRTVGEYLDLDDNLWGTYAQMLEDGISAEDGVRYMYELELDTWTSPTWTMEQSFPYYRTTPPPTRQTYAKRSAVACRHWAKALAAELDAYDDTTSVEIFITSKQSLWLFDDHPLFDYVLGPGFSAAPPGWLHLVVPALVADWLKFREVPHVRADEMLGVRDLDRQPEDEDLRTALERQMYRREYELLAAGEGRTLPDLAWT